MASPSDKPQSVISMLEESEKVARDILNDFSKGPSIETIARKCLLLAKLTYNARQEFFIECCLSGSDTAFSSILRLSAGSQKVEPEMLTALVDILNCFMTKGQRLTVESLSRYIIGEKDPKVEGAQLSSYSLPEAETFVKSARKQVTYSVSQQQFLESVQNTERILNRIKQHLHKFALDTYVEIRFGKIPQSIFEEQRRFVDGKLASLCPSALEKFAVAYEELQGKSAENWTNAVLGCRRILLDFADAVFPPRQDKYRGRDVGPDKYINRLWAYVGTAIESDKNRRLVRAELADLGSRIDAVYDMSCKGVHADIGKDEADRMVIKTYLLLADLLKLSQ